MSLRTLAIDTSLASGSVVATDADRLVEIELPDTGAHARRIAAALEQAANALGWRAGDVDLVAVIRGPGSFTGLRVGLSTAKALAWAAEAALVGVSGFEAIALRGCRHGEVPSGPLHIAYDAGRGEVFVTEATPDRGAASGFSLTTPRLVVVAEWLANLPRGAIVTGPGLDACAAELGCRDDLTVAPHAARLPSARDAAELALRLHAAGIRHAPESLAPDYLRPSYADESGHRPD